MNLDLNDRAWFDAIPVGGIGVHVVEGVRVVLASSPETGEDCPTGPDRGSTPRPFHPPPEWAALSEQKCETCRPLPNSSALLAVARSAGWEWCSEHNRPRWEGSNPCEHLHAREEEHEYWCPIHEGRECGGCSWTPARPGCPDCLGSGRPLVRVTVPFLATECETCEEDRTTSYHDSHDHAQYHGGISGRVSIGSVTVEAVEDQGDGKFGVIVRRVA